MQPFTTEAHRPGQGTFHSPLRFAGQAHIYRSPPWERFEIKQFENKNHRVRAQTGAGPGVLEPETVIK